VFHPACLHYAGRTRQLCLFQVCNIPDEWSYPDASTTAAGWAERTDRFGIIPFGKLTTDSPLERRAGRPWQ
jgi:hypothetical protein